MEKARQDKLVIARNAIKDSTKNGQGTVAPLMKQEDLDFLA
jgi:hypothetical protein